MREEIQKKKLNNVAYISYAIYLAAASASFVKVYVIKELFKLPSNTLKVKATTTSTQKNAQQDREDRKVEEELV